MSHNEDLKFILEYNAELSEVNKKLLNQSEALIGGMRQIIRLIDDNAINNRTDYQEVLQEIHRLINLSLTRSINYTKPYDKGNT